MNFLAQNNLSLTGNKSILHQNDIDSLKHELSIRKKSRRYKSRLDPYRQQILTLRAANIPYQGISYWLLTRQKITITPEAISARIKKWSLEDEK